MGVLDDWLNALSKPYNSEISKELDRWEEINTSLLSDLNPEMNFKDFPIAHIENAVNAINEKLEIEHSLHIEDRKSADRQKIIDRNRFIVTTIIGVVAAIAAIVGTTVSIPTYLS